MKENYLIVKSSFEENKQKASELRFEANSIPGLLPVEQGVHFSSISMSSKLMNSRKIRRERPKELIKPNVLSANSGSGCVCDLNIQQRNILFLLIYSTSGRHWLSKHSAERRILPEIHCIKLVLICKKFTTTQVFHYPQRI